MLMSNIWPLVLFVSGVVIALSAQRPHQLERVGGSRGREEGWGCTEALDPHSSISHTCIRFPHWKWDTFHIFLFSLLRQGDVHLDKWTSKSHVSLPKGRWLHAVEMKFILASLQSINIQDERCHPVAAREGSLCNVKQRCGCLYFGVCPVGAIVRCWGWQLWDKLR